MSCERCGSGAQGRLCAECEMMDRVEHNHEHLTSDADSDESDRPAEPHDVTAWGADDE